MTSMILQLCALLLLAAAPGTFAAASTTVFLEELTWTELRDEIRAGKTTIIVPIGGTEQNGPHMALGKHNARVKALAERSRANSAMRWSLRSLPMSPRAA